MTVRLFGVCIYFRFEIHLASYQPKILDLIPVSFEGLLKYHHLMSFTGFNGPHWVLLMVKYPPETRSSVCKQ